MAKRWTVRVTGTLNDGRSRDESKVAKGKAAAERQRKAWVDEAAKWGDTVTVTVS